MLLPAPQIIAFDLDGTLIDSRLDIAAACNHALVAAGREPMSPDAIAAFVGDGVRALAARVFGMDPADPGLDAHVEALVTYYEAHPVAHTRWLPGALETLEACRSMPLALVTNKARSITHAVLEALAALSRFAFVYAGGDGPLKPSADPILACARALRADVRAVWVVGDGEQDIGAARAAGAVAVGVLGGFSSSEKLRAAKPDALLQSIAELPGLARGG